MVAENEEFPTSSQTEECGAGTHHNNPAYYNSDRVQADYLVIGAIEQAEDVF
jgi:hypothetical protein